jgi:hypothetical protein
MGPVNTEKSAKKLSFCRIKIDCIKQGNTSEVLMADTKKVAQRVRNKKLFSNSEMLRPAIDRHKHSSIKTFKTSNIWGSSVKLEI